MPDPTAILLGLEVFVTKEWEPIWLEECHSVTERETDLARRMAPSNSAHNCHSHPGRAARHQASDEDGSLEDETDGAQPAVHGAPVERPPRGLVPLVVHLRHPLS